MGSYIQKQHLEDRLTVSVLENLSGKTGNELVRLLDAETQPLNTGSP